MYILIMKMAIFQVDLSDVSAKSATLVISVWVLADTSVRSPGNSLIVIVKSNVD